MCLVEFLGLLFCKFDLFVKVFAEGVVFFLRALQFFEFCCYVGFLLLDSVFGNGDFLVFLVEVSIVFGLELQEFFLCGKFLFLLDDFSFRLCLANNLVLFLHKDVVPEEE